MSMSISIQRTEEDGEHAFEILKMLWSCYDENSDDSNSWYLVQVDFREFLESTNSTSSMSTSKRKVSFCVKLISELLLQILFPSDKSSVNICLSTSIVI